MRRLHFLILVFLLTVFTIAVAGAAPVWQESGEDSSATEEKKEEEKEPEGLPLKPGHELSYTATEGTWISLDVSPDGKTIVFDLLGDLYSLPVAGGTATRLTSGMPFDAQLRFA